MPGMICANAAARLRRMPTSTQSSRRLPTVAVHQPTPDRAPPAWRPQLRAGPPRAMQRAASAAQTATHILEALKDSARRLNTLERVGSGRQGDRISEFGG